MKTAWAKTGWHAEVESWVAKQLSASGIRILGPVKDLRMRPWSAILSFPTSQGDVYFKALPPGLEYEVPLTVRLNALFPGRVLPLLGADPTRGWMLMPDGGQLLRDVIPV